ncbi:Flp family type IVb pilin [Geomonas sp. Red32]|uniref:Flp family type IVb pilin n=1 Tax=Geomonas sp. Red32 TaxID=2912856 RepID=UPI00202CEB8B|nr:Flp family type IVb pilin [Geomonas sp. Red32]MCM0083902.1 Flp family type IVb pilin [Geomonas sp. Red32]
MLIRLQTMLLNNQKGATMVEYAMMVALIAVIALTAVSLVGTNVTATFNSIAAKL